MNLHNILTDLQPYHHPIILLFLWGINVPWGMSWGGYLKAVYLSFLSIWQRNRYRIYVLRELTPGDRSHNLEKVQSGKMVLDETGIIRTMADETARCVLENSVSCDSAHGFFLGGMTRESKTLSLVVLCAP
jgi:hypothetical protein